ncbi:mitochondrial 37S ribosomal protein mS23 [Kluyveromyces lactis]|uniref:Small ribosomal subunit protein mS23 n=1 Tax=Kluyveromyces lactis (strain ATCC 8585 / CBS 2359 / DSM 70799 / NBRC 1267 / NRRL Y-1140 / WM37) TaxID=284590 RepID=RT25_KLULA|nr:mitochondrial 37S ribosomal protein RSM25 [Kluyveromyces lactis]Q6CP16.1 RecName: Full=Small ribosomal subunit protein mS23; AltName: Full=37S ribosomal protein S25, mitochondrial [Kluyveromyces lactis NRRL Y-1140]CAG99410.1 KLLA0E08273p [Kluyveromyces lactis]|eukprot:XP_454323.1 mitochondrial 37S ribosomal protein RSM25 [Kluyveromyces lactis]
MKVQQEAVNVLERTSAYLKSGILKKTPAWYNVIAKVPPTKKFARTPQLTHPMNGKSRTALPDYSNWKANSSGLYKTRPNSLEKKDGASKLYQSPKLVYIEDKLRKLFFQQHPWELSRPKILVENTLETQEYDWSHIQQLGKPLDGESVVQRTLFLLKSGEKKELIDAYDQARFEFYRLRIQQEIQDQVAQEEAEMFGSVFHTTSIEYGIAKEQKVIDTWKRKALQQAELMAARASSPSASWTNETEEEQKPIDQDVEEIQL